jgi:hypothetical protein
MDLEGFRRITDVLEEANIGDFQLNPKPEVSEDIGRIAITVNSTITSRKLENIFEEAGLLQSSEKPQIVGKGEVPLLLWRNTRTLDSKTSRVIEFDDTTVPVEIKTNTEI